MNQDFSRGEWYRTATVSMAAGWYHAQTRGTDPFITFEMLDRDVTVSVYYDMIAGRPRFPALPFDMRVRINAAGTTFVEFRKNGAVRSFPIKSFKVQLNEPASEPLMPIQVRALSSMVCGPSKVMVTLEASKGRVFQVEVPRERENEIPDWLYRSLLLGRFFFIHEIPTGYRVLDAPEDLFTIKRVC